MASACAVGPAYRKPSVPVPAAFKEQPPPDGDVGADWRPAEPKDDSAPRALVGSLRRSAAERAGGAGHRLEPDVAQAEAQFRGARAAVRGARADLFPTVTAGASVSASRASANRSVRDGTVDRRHHARLSAAG